MKKLRLNIDGKEVLGLQGQTILDVAKENGIDIPTLCYDDRTEIYGACGICVVEIEGAPRLFKACATEIADGMVIKTNTQRVRESRKTNLELLMSNHIGDCRAPCSLNCPAETDCQGYVGLIANGLEGEALKLIKEKIPLPASIGRVCPHPCEKKCRRGLVEEPISIASLKSYAADKDLASGNPYVPEKAPSTGKNVAVIGAGPMGLSAAYFLTLKGHDVTIFEAMPKAGGMLRYGIPEYRLPKTGVLDREIELITALGVEIKYNTKVGKDISFASLREAYDAVIVGIGAWLSTGIGCEGEDAEGVIGGIDFLRSVIRNEKVDVGSRVAIVGGGNTAMDACRTAVRLGAKEVYNIYRRTKDEMPADMIEIEEAEEEGVIFKNLTNPIEILKDKKGHVKEIVLQVMELGEPDASGRRAPVPVEGKTETLKVDTIIMAIGQKVNPDGFDGLDLTRKKGIVYDKDTFATSLEGVFAGGDCGNDKISIAIEAIADAKKVSDSVDAYLNGKNLSYKKPFVCERTDVCEMTFEDRERMCRAKVDVMDADKRKRCFDETVKGLSEEKARYEASRCLECGCHDYFECKLIRYSNEYNIKPSRLAGDINSTDYNDEHPFILRNPNKCILCGLCVRICDQVMGVGALGLVNRGFDTVVKPALEQRLKDSGCISCGQCVSVCPTGALEERPFIKKCVPLSTQKTTTTCSFCSLGCSVCAESAGDTVIKTVPTDKGILCAKGRFGMSSMEDRATTPMAKRSSKLAEIDYYNALVRTAKAIRTAILTGDTNSVAISVSDRLTNEDAALIKGFANAIGANTICFNSRKNGMKDILGADCSPNKLEEILATEVILAIGFDTRCNPIASLKMRQAAQNGTKIVLINPKGLEQKNFTFAETVYTENDLSFLKELYKALSGEIEGITVSDKAQEIANLYSSAKKALIVCQQNVLSEDAAAMAANIAVVSGHIGSPRNGIVLLRAKNNSQGLIDLGITNGAEAVNGVKTMLVFGEDAPIPTCVKFTSVFDTHITDTAKKADIFMPICGIASVDGTYTNTDGDIMKVCASINEPEEYSIKWIIEKLSEILEIKVIPAKAKAYRTINIGAPALPCGSEFVSPVASTDNLMNRISAKLASIK